MGRDLDNSFEQALVILGLTWHPKFVTYVFSSALFIRTVYRRNEQGS